MTIGRPHRPALPRDEALREIRRLKGRQFDPAVVDAFELALGELGDQPGNRDKARGPMQTTRG